MLYFKNVDLADEYHISEGTVRNWIKEAKDEGLDLKLHKTNGRLYIANTANNRALIEQLVAERKKYRNTRAYKVTKPTARFYDLFSRSQIADIITNLDVRREIPRQYNYFDGGAAIWEHHAQRMWEDEAPNLLTSTVRLLNANLSALDFLLQGHDRVNVVDIGPGNALPVRELLEHLLKRGLLHRYIAIDISEEMLRIAERNIKEWFDEKVAFEGYIKDINYERFDDVLLNDRLNEEASRTVNLAILLGATPMNFRTPYDLIKTIYTSLDRDDLLIYSDKPDTEVGRRSFDVNDTWPNPGARALSPKYSFILDLLNIDESLYDVEMGFHEQKRARYIRIRLKIGLMLEFDFKEGKRAVELAKGDTILLWRFWHQTATEIISGFENAGFNLALASLTKDQQFLLTISRVNNISGI